MELTDYLAALRRRWLTWAVIFALSIGAALVAITTLPRTYQATAQIFVGTASDSASGFQFVSQRVKSYPDIAESPVVLVPVITALDLPESFEELRGAVSARNPTDTSQIEITVTFPAAETAADIANAAAERFTRTVVELEQGASETSPVTLTITSPATVPSSPVSPVPHLLLALGFVFGSCVGAAVAILRDRMDSRVHTVADLRRAWGADDDDLTVITPTTGSARRSRLIGRPATLLSRRLQDAAELQPLRVLLLSPTVGEEDVRRLAEDVAEELTRTGTTAVVATGPDATNASRGPGKPADWVRLVLGTALGPPGELRAYRGKDAAVVVVIGAGRVQAAELSEVRRRLDVLGLEPLSFVILRPGPGSRLRRLTSGHARIPVRRLAVKRPAGRPDEVAVRG
ncbi:YveK family protein [Blastococcus goldschmidtiae]|uniref:Wzz/FepE/Etk N-terminal domain-containing protein n=1 Tax=Blastococcus goldschmidtiae TaxID=3075546 RepID=A0ABU2K680_9ACTN|nr:Wzz/FepE/Etk N-terminal domain-containing protein [Blastococcus sp. DSM 46792]MDT0275706.1 Wzz/FepE/Etk N-terminal domain-containing protein [Blastococcus sp. DSM 46792]